LELIGALVGRAVLALVRGISGGAAAAGGLGKDLTDIMKSISKGEGLDTEAFQKKMDGLTDTFDKTIVPTIEGVGKTIGKVVGYSWPATIGAVLGSVMLTKFIGDAFGGMMRRALGGTVERSLGVTFGNFLGRLLRIGGTGTNLAEAAAGGALRAGGATMGAAGTLAATAATTAGRGAASAAGEALRGIATQGQAAGGVLRLLTMNVSALGPALKGGISSFTGGMGNLLGAIGPIGSIALVFGAAVTSVAKDIETSALKRRQVEEEVTAATNKHLLSIQKSTEALQKNVGLDNRQAFELIQKARAGKEALSVDEKRLLATKRELLLMQAKAYTMTEERLLTQRHLGLEKQMQGIRESHAQIWTPFGNLNIPQSIIAPPRYQTGEYGQAAIEDVKAKQEAEQARRDMEALRRQFDQAINEYNLQKYSQNAAVDGAMQEDIGDAAGGKKTTVAAPTTSYHQVVLDLKGNDEKTGLYVDQRVKLNISRGVVAPGPSAMSGMRHGGEGEGYPA
jgi:hypothetical protein